jgi:rsbT co-antagonist protein RsbR
MSSETITRLEAENAALRQRINELEMRLEAYHTGNAMLRTTGHTGAFNEFQGFRTTVERASQGIVIVHLEGVITYVNSAFCALTGYHALVGRHISTLYFEYDLPLLDRGLQKVRYDGIWQDNISLRRSDGAAIPVHIDAFLICDDAGQPAAITVIVEDLTEELRREERLRLFEALVENAPDAIGVANVRGNVIYANTAYQTLTGCGDQLIGMNAFDGIVEHDRQAVRTALARLEDNNAVVLDIRIQRRDGGIVPVSAAMYAQRSPRDEVWLIGFLRDISDQKRAEAERFALQQQVIEAQRAAIRELSTPLIPISETAVIMPLVGAIDSARAQQIIDTLLEGVAAHRADVAIVDITGVQVVDTQVASALVRAAQAVRLLGAQVILTGIKPQVAQTLVQLGVSLEGIRTTGSLQTGIRLALDHDAIRRKGAGR